MQKIRRRRIGEILIAEGLITQEQLTAALEVQKTSQQPVAEILLSQGFLTENDIVRAICIQNQLPFIRPKNYQLEASLIEAFPVELLWQHRLVPLDKIGSSFIVAVGRIPNEQVTQHLQEALGGEVHYYFSSATDVEDLLREHFNLSQEQVIAFATPKQAQAASSGNPEDHQSLLATLDNSWEAIFDDAENNVAQ